VLEHVGTVVVQVGVLVRWKISDSDSRIDSPSVEKLFSDLRNDNEFLVVREGNVAFIEEMIDVRRQEQPVRTVDLLGRSGLRIAA
jgi:hypothetical protein